MRILVILALTTSLLLIPACSSTPDFYEDHQYEYLNIPSLSGSTYNPYIIGKVIAINMQDGELDDVYYKLPNILKAKSHEEIGMVVWLEWGEKLIGTYTDGWKGYAHTCNITIIDFSNNTVVDEKYFEGADPPDSKDIGGDVWGSMPTKDIVKYIEALPQTLTDRQAQNQPTVTPASTTTTESAPEQPEEPVESPTQSMPTPVSPIAPE